MTYNGAHMMLINACRSSSVYVVKWILDNKDININTKDQKGWTALMHAAYEDSNEIVLLLLDCLDVNVNHQSLDGDTALIQSVYWNSFNVVVLLLSHKDVDVNLKKLNGDTALIMAVKTSRVANVERLLNHNNIKIDIQNNAGYTALAAAIKCCNVKIIKLLLTYGATIPNPLSCHHKDIRQLLENWRTYLPRWNRFRSYNYYPTEFNRIAFAWLLCCKRLKVFPKDIRYLMIEYVAEAWKYF